MTDVEPESPWPVGRVIGGKYLLVRMIGRGGMSVVYEAQNTWTGRWVAIKALSPAAGASAASAQRLLREAQNAARIQHPNVVEVLDMGREEPDGTLFVVQELLAGEDLERHLARLGPLLPAPALAILLPIVDALAAAHARGVIHRDVKPANIFLATLAGGEVVPKLIDFGISKSAAEGQGRAAPAFATQDGALLGTPSYMSPEQARGDVALDARTDVWSLGVVLYEALAGRPPFAAETASLALAAVLHERPPRIERYVPGIDPELASVVHGALERDRGERVPSMEALLSALSTLSVFDEVRWSGRYGVPHGAPPAPRPSGIAPRPGPLALHAVARDGRQVRTLDAPAPQNLAEPVAPGAPADVLAFPGSAVRRAAHPRTPPRQSAAGEVVSVRAGPARLGIAATTLELRAPGVLRAASAALGPAWVVRRGRSYAGLVDALVEGVVDAAWLPPVAYARARRLGRVQPLLTFQREGRAAYASALIARAERAAGAASLEDALRGARVAWVHVWSAAGYLVPRGTLRARGLEPERLFASQALLGSHAAVLRAVVRGQADVGAVGCALDAAGRLQDAPWLNRGALAVLALSAPIPGDVICVGPHVTPAEAAALTAAFVGIAAAGAREGVLARVFRAAGVGNAHPEPYATLEDALEQDVRAARTAV
jgi:serine/threonine-protein kinase